MSLFECLRETHRTPDGRQIGQLAEFSQTPDKWGKYSQKWLISGEYLVTKTPTPPMLFNKDGTLVPKYDTMGSLKEGAYYALEVESKAYDFNGNSGISNKLLTAQFIREGELDVRLPSLENIV